MAYTYSTFLTTVANIAVYDPTNTNFLQIFPSAIAYAEDRIYRELDMLVEKVRDSSASCTAGDRNFNLPTSIGVFSGPLDGINVITPASTAPDSGTRHRLTSATLDVLDWSWPSVTGTGLPQFFAYFSQSAISGQKNIVFGPWPDAAYHVEVIGTIQPSALSDSNTTTYLSTYLPDLFLAATMVFMAGFQRDFGSQSDNPKDAQSWEQQYQLLKASAETWESRKRWAGPSWTSKALEPAAVPQRG